MATNRFLRRNTSQYLRLGKKRKKKLKWKKPNGRDNKMRLKIKGYPRVVAIGFKSDNKIRGKYQGNKIIDITDINQIKNVNEKRKNEVFKLGRFGNKKKIEIAKIAKDKNLDFINFNYKSFLKKIEKMEKSKK